MSPQRILLSELTQTGPLTFLDPQNRNGLIGPGPSFLGEAHFLDDLLRPIISRANFAILAGHRCTVA